MPNKDIVPALFEGHKIRTTHEGQEVIYCLSDICAAITGTSNPNAQIYNIKKSLEKQGIQLSQILREYKFKASNGRHYRMWGGTRKEILRILQELRHPNVAPFKMWFADLVEERLEEIENPAKGVENAIEAYKRQGKSDPWIEARIKGIAIRKGETAVLQSHGITKAVDFAHFTDRTNVAVYGHKAQTEKALRGISKSQSLRDCSTETELGLLFLHESACRDGIEETEAYGRTQIDGVYDVVGGIIANTKQALESAFKPSRTAGTD